MPPTYKPLPYREQPRTVPWRWVIRGTGRWADRLARETQFCGDLPARNPATRPDLEWTSIPSGDLEGRLGVLVFDDADVQLVSDADLTDQELLYHGANALTRDEDEHRHLVAVTVEGVGIFAMSSRDAVT